MFFCTSLTDLGTIFDHLLIGGDVIVLSVRTYRDFRIIRFYLTFLSNLSFSHSEVFFGKLLTCLYMFTFSFTYNGPLIMEKEKVLSPNSLSNLVLQGFICEEPINVQNVYGRTSQILPLYCRLTALSLRLEELKRS